MCFAGSENSAGECFGGRGGYHAPLKKESENALGSGGAMLAEREGFEPSIRLPVYMLSRHAPSTTRPSLQTEISFCIAFLLGLAVLAIKPSGWEAVRWVVSF